MGLGPTASGDKKDFLESLIIAEPANAAARYCNAVYGFMLRHRAALGLPAGDPSFPFFVCSNDLVAKFLGLLDLVHAASREAKSSGVPHVPHMADVADMRRDMIASSSRIVDLLLETYDGGCDGKDNGSSSCCKMWHSASKAEIEEMRRGLATAFV